MMPKYIQTINVDHVNNTSHSVNIEVADSISQIFNMHLVNPESSFIYDGNTCQVSPRSDDKETEIIGNQINCFIRWNNKFSDKNDYLNAYLINDCFPVLENENYETVFPLFTNLNLVPFLDEISANFIKEKINEKINALKEAKNSK